MRSSGKLSQQRSPAGVKTTGHVNEHYSSRARPSMHRVAGGRRYHPPHCGPYVGSGKGSKWPITRDLACCHLEPWCVQWCPLGPGGMFFTSSSAPCAAPLTGWGRAWRPPRGGWHTPWKNTWADTLWAFSFTSISSSPDQLLEVAQRRGECWSPCWWWGGTSLQMGSKLNDTILTIDMHMGNWKICIYFNTVN